MQKDLPPAHPLFRDVMYHIVLMPSLIESQKVLMGALKILCFSMLSSTFLKLINLKGKIDRRTYNNFTLSYDVATLTF